VLLGLVQAAGNGPKAGRSAAPLRRWRPARLGDPMWAADGSSCVPAAASAGCRWQWRRTCCRAPAWRCSTTGSRARWAARWPGAALPLEPSRAARGRGSRLPHTCAAAVPPQLAAADTPTPPHPPPGLLGADQLPPPWPCRRRRSWSSWSSGWAASRTRTPAPPPSSWSLQSRRVTGVRPPAQPGPARPSAAASSAQPCCLRACNRPRQARAQGGRRPARNTSPPTHTHTHSSQDARAPRRYGSVASADRHDVLHVSWLEESLAARAALPVMPRHYLFVCTMVWWAPLSRGATARVPGCQGRHC
jgi:hypothetical protein